MLDHAGALKHTSITVRERKFLFLRLGRRRSSVATMVGAGIFCISIAMFPENSQHKSTFDIFLFLSHELLFKLFDQLLPSSCCYSGITLIDNQVLLKVFTYIAECLQYTQEHSAS